jgi:hypothetical protein
MIGTTRCMVDMEIGKEIAQMTLMKAKSGEISEEEKKKAWRLLRLPNFNILSIPFIPF